MLYNLFVDPMWVIGFMTGADLACGLIIAVIITFALMRQDPADHATT